MELMAASDCDYIESDIRCKGLPKDMNEDELIPLFERHGQVLGVRKIVDANIVFASYTNVNDAENAVRHLHGSNIRGCTLKVRRSVNQESLIVRGIPKHMPRQKLFQAFSSMTMHTLRSVHVYNDPSDDTAKNRGFCYLTFRDHCDAVNAKKLLSTRGTLLGKQIIVEWPNRTFELQKTRDKLYITNLRPTIRSNDLVKYFSAFGQLADVKLRGHFAVVQFKMEEDAIRAAREVDRKLLGNENVDIMFAKLSDAMDPTLSDTLYITATKLLPPADLQKIFSEYGEVVKVDRHADFVSVRFRHVKQAANAKNSVSFKRIGSGVQISFFKPTESTNDNTSSTVSSDKLDTLYIRNILPSISARDLRVYFSIYGDVLEVDKTDNVAAVSFRDPRCAKQVVREFDKRRLGDRAEISLHGNPIQDTLYIYNMYGDMTTQRLRKIFSDYGDVRDVDVSKHSASIRFGNANQCKQAAGNVVRAVLGDESLQISFAPKKM